MVEKTARTAPLASRVSGNIAARRRELGLTQAQLAERCGVETETLSRFERGKHLPSLATLERMAVELGLTVADLLGETPVPTAEEAGLVSAWLHGLGTKDRAFVLELLRSTCQHLRARNL